MRVVADNDIIGAVAALRRILQSPEWAEYSDAVAIDLIGFEELSLARNAADRDVWLACQRAEAVLITGNRTSGEDSLDRAIRECSDATSLPVVTLADPQRVLRDREYATTAAIRLLDFLDRIDSLRGTGRLFVP